MMVFRSLQFELSFVMNKYMNEYDVREAQIQDIVEERQGQSEQRQEWDYKSLTSEVMMAPRFKYQNVEMSHRVQFIDDVRSIIYDEKTNPEDVMLLKNWDLSPFEQRPLKLPEHVPPQVRILKKGINATEFDRNFGKFQKEGEITAKSNEVHYTQYHYNLRSNTLFIYPPTALQDCQKQLFYIELNQRSYDYCNFSDDYFLVRGDPKSLKIKRDESAQELIKMLEKKLLVLSFRGAFAIRNQLPPWQLEDYIEGHIDKIGPIHFEKENHIKEIVTNKHYKEIMGAFFFLLKKFSQNRNNISGEIMVPRWLKSEFKELPNFQVNLVTNIVPYNFSLQNLKIKIEPMQMQSLVFALKSIFPFYKNYLKRSLVVYDSELTDENLRSILTQLSYPMYMLGFPNNCLSISSLESCVQSASNLYHEVIDYSYNSKLTSIGQSRLFNAINTNPSIKKLILKGCYVLEGEAEDFFEGLTNNLCLSELEIDFLDHYGSPCVKSMKNYAAYIY